MSVCSGVTSQGAQAWDILQEYEAPETPPSQSEQGMRAEE